MREIVTELSIFFTSFGQARLACPDVFMDLRECRLQQIDLFCELLSLLLNNNNAKARYEPEYAVQARCARWSCRMACYAQAGHAGRVHTWARLHSDPCPQELN